MYQIVRGWLEKGVFGVWWAWGDCWLLTVLFLNPPIRNWIKDILRIRKQLSFYILMFSLMGSSVVQIEHDKEITKNQSFVRNMISWPIMAIGGSIRPRPICDDLAWSASGKRGSGHSCNFQFFHYNSGPGGGDCNEHRLCNLAPDNQNIFCIGSISLQLALLVNKSKFAKRSWTHIMSPLLNHVQVLESGSTHGNAWFTGTGKTGPIICWSCLWLMASITSIYCFMLCHNSLIHNSAVLWRSPPTTTVRWAGFKALT